MLDRLPSLMSQIIIVRLETHFWCFFNINEQCQMNTLGAVCSKRSKGLIMLYQDICVDQLCLILKETLNWFFKIEARGFANLKNHFLPKIKIQIVEILVKFLS